MKQAIKKAKKFSGHGSLTKAGKVRDNTPKIKGADRRSPTPMAGNRRKAGKRFRENHPIKVGQHYLEKGRRR